MSDKVMLVVRQDEPAERRMMFWCPGCKSPHQLRIAGKGDVWQFNGNCEKPTFSPSLLTEKNTPRHCHLYIKDGMVEYLHDCTHELAGTTVELPDLETWR